MKIKQRLLGLCEACLMVLVIIGISKIPVGVTEVIKWTGCILAGVMFVVWLCIFLYKWRKLSLVLLLMVNIGVACAQGIDTEANCDEYEKGAEQDRCRYNYLYGTTGNEICNYMKGFNPLKPLTGDKAIDELEEHIKMANNLLSAHRRLQKSYQYDLDRCITTRHGEVDESPSDIMKTMHKNNHPVCCSLALQELHQIYATTHSETRVKTVLSLMADDNMNCWPCDVIFLMATVINTITWNAQPFMSKAALFLVEWIFVFWMLFKVGMLFLGRLGGAEFLKSFLIQLILLMLACAILIPPSHQINSRLRSDTMLDEAYANLLNPPFTLIVSAGAEITRSLINGKDSFLDRLIEEAKKSPNDADRRNIVKLMMSDYCTNWEAIMRGSLYEKLQKLQYKKGYHLADWSNEEELDGRILGTDLTGGMLCLTQKSYTGMSPISAAGSVLLSYGIENGSSLAGLLPAPIPKLGPFFVGLTIQIIAWLLGITVCFDLMDVMLRLGFVVILTPIFIATALFPLTRHYSTVAFRFFLNAIMRFVEISMAVAMVVPFFFRALSGGDGDELVKMMVAPSDRNYAENLYNATTAGGLKTFFVIVGIGWLAFQMLKVSQAIFENIFDLVEVSKKSGRYFNVGGRDSGNLAQIGTMSGALLDARKTIGGAVPAVKGLGQMAGNTKLGRGVTSFVDGAKAAGSRYYNGAKQAAGRAIDGAANAADRGINNLGTMADRWATSKGAALSATGAGAIIGVPLMALGKVAKAGAWLAGKTAKYGIKSTKVAGRAVEKSAKFSGKAGKEGLKKFFFVPEEKKKKK